MKKVLFLVLTLLSFTPIMVAQTGGDDPVVILIGDGGTGLGGPSHYAPVLTPIQAAYYPSLSSILVNFRWDLGSVSVEIENLTTQEYCQMTINATQGVHPFLISGTSGTWMITFTLSSGVQYSGTFLI